MNISPTSATTQALPANKVAAAKPVATPAATSAVNDRVEIGKSDGFQRLLSMATNGDIRADKVADIKSQIQAGTYDLDAKADVVADRMLEDL